jgi:hypothetical protein
MPDPFVTVDDLTDYLGRDVTTDPGAVLALDAACDICRDIAECQFNAGTATVAFDGTGTDALVLPGHPVSAVSAVNVTGAAVTDFSFRPDGVLFRGTAGGLPRTTWPEGRQNVQVTYVHGFPSPELPRSVRMVALNIAARIVVQGIASSESVGEVNVSYAAPAMELTPNEERVLKRYRRTRSF